MSSADPRPVARASGAAGDGGGAARASGVEVTGLGKAHAGVRVLDGLDLSVPHGELTAVIGRSGGGKTTLLRLIAGFDRPDRGTITVGGRPALALPPERRRVGYVTQEGSLFPHLTVTGNVAFGLPWRRRRARDGVREMLELVGLDVGLADRYPHELSGGEQQRVALARALAPRPDAVLLDEPFSALDPAIRVSTRLAVTAALAATSTTTILVTHDLPEAMSLATRVAVLRDGAIAQVGEPADLYLRPADAAIAAFTGEVCEIPAKLLGDHASTALGPLPLPQTAFGAGFVLVRPEQITVDEAAPARATVTGTDFRGHDGLIRLRNGENEVTARCAAHLVPELGTSVGLRLTGIALATRIPPD
ncbi:ABC transporter ATP-binding protein [Actinoplanes bogorensis]|uniref:ABC transporter ATP-binding protein n=1 Tax=Paractinoplanes bogorensis TaxID=1610840 RepID=A0ABS5YZ31_9ACTN|nr:ABC transporter ATP-binding protein [Actinoplanes bogorensis]MBU2667968.1 ABC transporter ATP-binding protein [Actinoplanes bogorensis]